MSNFKIVVKRTLEHLKPVVILQFNIILYSMKHSLKKAAKILKDIFTFIKKNNIILDENSKITIYNYLLETTDIDYDEFIKVVKDENEDELMPSIAERLLNKGKDEGLKIGEEKGIKIGEEKNQSEVVINMDENGFSLEQISLATKLPIDKIKEILKDR